MISKAERQHLVHLEQWSVAARESLRQTQKDFPALKGLIDKVGQNPETIFDNFDWLLALIRRELHTKGVKDLLAAVDAYSESRK